MYYLLPSWRQHSQPSAASLAVGDNVLQMFPACKSGCRIGIAERRGRAEMVLVHPTPALLLLGADRNLFLAAGRARSSFWTWDSGSPEDSGGTNSAEVGDLASSPPTAIALVDPTASPALATSPQSRSLAPRTAPPSTCMPRLNAPTGERRQWRRASALSCTSTPRSLSEHIVFTPRRPMRSGEPLPALLPVSSTRLSVIPWTPYL